MKTNLLYAILTLTVGAGCGVDTIENPGGDNPGADGGGGSGDDGGGDVTDNRVTDQLQLLYRFDGVAGQTTVADTSGVGDPFDITIADPLQVTWEGGGMTFIGPTIAQNPNPMSKVMTGCMASNTMSVEAWVKNASIAPEANGRIISSGINADTHNFALKQQADYWELRLRTSQNNTNGNDPYQAASPIGTGTILDQHIVATRSSVGVANFYIDGVKQSPDSVPGNFGNWDLTYGVAVGNEVSLDRPWLGTVYLVAVYCKELTPAEVAQNYGEGH